MMAGKPHRPRPSPTMFLGADGKALGYREAVNKRPGQPGCRAPVRIAWRLRCTRNMGALDWNSLFPARQGNRTEKEGLLSSARGLAFSGNSLFRKTGDPRCLCLFLAVL